MHIAIAGNIGSGKTTLTRMLATHYGWVPRYEAVAENPYIADYYKDIPRWAFNMEVFFLKERFRDLLEISQMDQTVVQDRTIYEGVYVFARNNQMQGNMSDQDFEVYMELFQLMTDVVKYPDLMIYLKSDISHLVANIHKRGREYEQAIKLEYLQGLNELYDQFIYQDYKGRVLTIDANTLDFEHSTQDFNQIIQKTDALLYRLFPLNE